MPSSTPCSTCPAKSRKPTSATRQSFEAKRASLGDAHPSVTISLNNFGSSLAGPMGRVEEGEARTREAIALDRQIFGDRHSYVAEGLRNLGIIQRGKVDYAAADSSLREALAIDRALLGERHLKIANIYGQLAQVRYLTGDMGEAVTYRRESLSQYREFVGEEHLNTTVTSANLARMLAQGRVDAALAELEPTLTLARGTFGARDVRTAFVQLTTASARR